MGNCSGKINFKEDTSDTEKSSTEKPSQFSESTSNSFSNPERGIPGININTTPRAITVQCVHDETKGPTDDTCLESSTTVSNDRSPKETIELRKDYDRKQQTINQMAKELESFRNVCNTMKRNIHTLQEENNDLRNRLSANASSKLRDNNPNIVDLSDVNRPNKIGERFSELYDNEWTNAFAELHESSGKSEKEAIKILLDIIKTTYDTCVAISMKQLGELKSQILVFTGKHEFVEEKMSVSIKGFKDERRKNFKEFLPFVQMEAFKEFDANYINIPCIKAFIDMGIELCWLMCIQDPPVVMYTDCVKGHKFDADLFKGYTHQSKTVKYLVWPALLLHENGPLLSKGVAQGKRKKTKDNAIKSGNKISPNEEAMWATKKGLSDQGSGTKIPTATQSMHARDNHVSHNTSLQGTGSKSMTAITGEIHL